MLVHLFGVHAGKTPPSSLLWGFPLAQKVALRGLRPQSVSAMCPPCVRHVHPRL